MNVQAEQARLIAEAIAKDLEGAPEGAAEYDRRAQAKLEKDRTSAIPKEHVLIPLYRAFWQLDIDVIRDCAGDISTYKRIAENMPELKNLCNELIGHTQTLLEIYMRQAEDDSKRLAEFAAVPGS